ncbi:hypothetical protein QUC31_015395 [Theobroma cacao]|nr:Alpha/beta-Hydrolases superfamily protein, putative isoform 1 [Theobroma cacao]
MSFLKIYKFLLHGVLKLAGISPRTIEIEPGTIMNFWVPTETINNTNTKRKKPAVVFLHGFGFDGILTWQFQALALAKEYSVYVPDFLFFGGSITDKTERSVEFQAECMAKGLRKLGVEKCTLVGFSYGGMVGFKMAEMYPDLVESMVVTCSVMALTESISNAGLERIGFPSWADYLLPVSVKGVETLLQVATYSFPKLPNWIYKDILENIYLLWGQNDKIFDLGTARNLKQQIREKASLEYIEKSGHLVQLERPFVYNSHLKKILASLWSKEKSHATDAFPQPKKK